MSFDLNPDKNTVKTLKTRTHRKQKYQEFITDKAITGYSPRQRLGANWERNSRPIRFIPGLKPYLSNAVPKLQCLPKQLLRDLK